MKNILILLLFLNSLSTYSSELVERLKRTKATNQFKVYQELGIEELNHRSGPSSERKIFKNGLDFITRNPYYPKYGGNAQPKVESWYKNLSKDKTVCAVKFLDDEKINYELKSFPNKKNALKNGYIVTHSHKCGTCSTLKDLAVYLGTPDLTTPARVCAKKMKLEKVKRCLEKIGFTEMCAEQWAYNASHTKKHCSRSCVKTYGLINILRNKYNAPNNLPDGSLNDCIKCDEEKSGAGFKYGAGRTRRWSGLPSAIVRERGEITPIDHSLYFKN